MLYLKEAAETLLAVKTHCLLSPKSQTAEQAFPTCLSWKTELLDATFQVRLVQATECSHIPLILRNKQLGFYHQCNEGSRAAAQADKPTGSCKERSSTGDRNSLCSAQLPQWPIQLMAKAMRLDIPLTGCIPPSICI